MLMKLDPGPPKSSVQPLGLKNKLASSHPLRNPFCPTSKISRAKVLAFTFVKLKLSYFGKVGKLGIFGRTLNFQDKHLE